ncbi:hypothetical protein Hanom_Chr12g01117191 [Helianthus anomalus]
MHLSNFQNYIKHQTHELPHNNIVPLFNLAVLIYTYKTITQSFIHLHNHSLKSVDVKQTLETHMKVYRLTSFRELAFSCRLSSRLSKLCLKESTPSSSN